MIATSPEESTPETPPLRADIAFTGVRFGLSAFNWKHCKHPLPEDVYDTYMRYWRDIELTKQRSAFKRMG